MVSDLDVSPQNVVYNELLLTVSTKWVKLLHSIEKNIAIALLFFTEKSCSNWQHNCIKTGFRITCPSSGFPISLWTSCLNFFGYLMNDALYRFQHYFSHIKVTDQLLMYFLNVTSNVTWQIPSESLYWHSVASKVSVKESTYTDRLIFFFFSNLVFKLLMI